MLNPSFQPRKYQAALAARAVREDLLCVLPTHLFLSKKKLYQKERRP